MSKKSIKRGISTEGGKRLYEWASGLGWTAEIRNNHVHYSHPHIPRKFVGALTDSDHRGWMNTRAQMRRAMMDAGYRHEQVR